MTGVRLHVLHVMLYTYGFIVNHFSLYGARFPLVGLRREPTTWTWNAYGTFRMSRAIPNRALSLNGREFIQNFTVFILESWSVSYRDTLFQYLDNSDWVIRSTDYKHKQYIIQRNCRAGTSSFSPTPSCYLCPLDPFLQYPRSLLSRFTFHSFNCTW